MCGSNTRPSDIQDFLKWTSVWRSPNWAKPASACFDVTMLQYHDSRTSIPTLTPTPTQYIGCKRDYLAQGGGILAQYVCCSLIGERQISINKRVRLSWESVRLKSTSGNLEIWIKVVCVVKWRGFLFNEKSLPDLVSCIPEKLCLKVHQQKSRASWALRGFSYSWLWRLMVLKIPVKTPPKKDILERERTWYLSTSIIGTSYPTPQSPFSFAWCSKTNVLTGY